MIEKVVVDLTGGRLGLLGAVFRYEVLERLARSAAMRSVTVLAFGFGGSELRLLLEGERGAITNVLRGLKVGTIRAAARWGITFQSGPNTRAPVEDRALLDAVVWAHRAPVDAGARGPLASPWSSHRDLLGYRRAAFFDPAAVSGRIDLRELQRRCGDPLPERWPCPPETVDLGFLLRLAGAVLGVLPADRKCFRLFVHLARGRGWSNRQLAEALSLTGRRVRQLANETEPELPTALAVMADPRLSRIP